MKVLCVTVRTHLMCVVRSVGFFNCEFKIRITHTMLLLVKVVITNLRDVLHRQRPIWQLAVVLLLREFDVQIVRCSVRGVWPGAVHSNVYCHCTLLHGSGRGLLESTDFTC